MHYPLCPSMECRSIDCLNQNLQIYVNSCVTKCVTRVFSVADGFVRCY